MNNSYRSRALRGLASSLIFALVACADGADPMGPGAGSVAAAQAGLVSGSYEAGEPVTLPGGARLYRVGVYFGDEPTSPTYLAQVGVSDAAGARLLMEQEQYVRADDELQFASLVQHGSLRENGRVLEAVVVVEGRPIRVTLARR